MGCDSLLDLLLGGILFEVKPVKFQAQFSLAWNLDFEEDMLEIRFHSPHRNAHVEGNLLVFVPQAG
jgi:hypothetical protein